MECSNRFPLFGRFGWASGPFWAKKRCLGVENGQFWEGTSRFVAPAPGKQASKQASNNDNKHFSFPFWPLLRLITPGSRERGVLVYILPHPSPLIYTPLPNSRWIHRTALRYVRRVHLGAYMWRKELHLVKTGLLEHPLWSRITFGKTRF